MVADVLMNPKLASSDLEKARAKKLREIAIARAEAGNPGIRKVPRDHIQRSSVFVSYGVGSSVQSYKLDDVRGYYNYQYGASRTHLYVVGQFDTGGQVDD